jgi:hypothetical protein
MKRGLYSPACCALSLAIAAAASCGLAMVTSPKDSFAPYQVIIDRAIFGKPPPAKVAPVAAPVPDPAQKLAEALAKKITLKAVNRTPSGNTAVGLIDNDAKPPRILYLNVGDTVDGYTILAADCDAETATIEKDGVVISLQLSTGLVIAATPTVATPALASAAGPTPVSTVLATVAPPKFAATAATTPTDRPGVIHRPSSAGVPLAHRIPTRQRKEMEQQKQELAKIRESGGDIRSYMETLRERQAQEREEQNAVEEAARQKIQELARQMSEEELRKKEREINLSLIEGGSRPISDIELTPEEEAALLKKGVL